MVIFGFMLNYALRVNLTIAIVAMVVDKPHNTTTALNGSNITTLALNDTLHGIVTESVAALASAPNLASTTSAQSLVALQNLTDEVSEFINLLI